MPSSPLVITISDRANPRLVLGYYDASKAGFSTDPQRAIKFEKLDLACRVLGLLRFKHPQIARNLYVRTQTQGVR